MSRNRDRKRRVYQPIVGDRLEPRDLPSGLPLGAGAAILQERAAVARAARLGSRGVVRAFTTDLGRSVTLTDTDFERYRVTVLNGGTVQAQSLPGGRVALFIRGTGPSSEVEINNIGRRPPDWPLGHTFSPLQPFQDRQLNVGLIEVTSGQINGIFGYGTTTLSGPLIVRGDQPVERIALTRMTPPASINVGGTLNTLDILHGADFAGPGSGLFIGRDLNSLTVNEDFVVRDGAQVSIGRDLGLLAQPAKGTGPAGQGARFNGDLIIGPGSTFFINRNLGAPVGVNAGTNQVQLTVGEFSVLGDFAGTSRLGIGGQTFAQFQIFGTPSI